jgi:hypothetical protein
MFILIDYTKHIVIYCQEKIKIFCQEKKLFDTLYNSF